MINLIHAFFASLAETISSIWEFLKFAFDELISFFRMVGSAVAFAFQLVNYVPTVYKAFIFAIILVLIIYVIVGRTAGGD